MMKVRGKEGMSLARDQTIPHSIGPCRKNQVIVRMPLKALTGDGHVKA
jgi:hypothetical protein